jgi:serine/threonine protein phosphatase PrpC
MEDNPGLKRLRWQWRVLTVAKDADYPDENQDVVCVDGEHGAAAIADGVGSSLFARAWAAILVEAAVRDQPNPDDRQMLAAWLAELRAAWRRPIDVARLAWFQKAKLREGAFSTLLAVRLVPPQPLSDEVEPAWRLQGMGIGDSCLFHLRGGRLLRKFPVQTSAELDHHPLVLGSVDLNRDEHLAFARFEEPCREGDLVILCTDAFADWALRQEEDGRAANWEEYWDMEATAWKERILSLRSEGEIRSDDTTLVMLRIVGDPREPSHEEGH